MDFTPLADRLRVMSSLEHNLRFNPDTGVLVATDVALAYGGGDPNVGANPSIAALAYSSNAAGTFSTTAYAYDSALGILASLASANTGVLSTIGSVAITLPTPDHVGLDIATGTGTAYLSVVIGGQGRLQTVNTSTGSAALVGDIGTAIPDVCDITVRPNVVSVASTETVTTERAGAVATITLSRDGAYESSVLAWNAAAGTASSGEFEASGTATFAAGETTTTFTVPIVDDSDDESIETFTVTISPAASPLNGVPVVDPSAATATVIVGDDDLAPTPTTPADVRAPFVYLVQPASTSVSAFVRSGLVAITTVDEATTGSATLRLGTRVVGRTSIRSTGAAALTTRIRPTLAGRRAIAGVRTRTVRLTLTVTLADAAGNTTTRVRTVTLRR